MPAKVLTGLDQVDGGKARQLRNKKIGLVVHPPSVTRTLKHAIDVFREQRLDVRAIFGPQHGLFGNDQDNMIEWEGSWDQALHIPVHSLYGKHRTPTAAMMKDIDVMVVDLQDVGARVYTFIQTLYLIMKSCARHNKEVVVLDRPNPIGSTVEGPVLKKSYRSFVGLTEIPLRHGLRVGELAKFYNKTLHCKLTVIEVKNGNPSAYWDQTELPWVLPSPNLPTLDTAIVYPGTVLVEGTNLSEGRGTTRPFEIIGAPGVEPTRLVADLQLSQLHGVKFRPLFFEPTFNKHHGKLCGGVQLHVTNRKTFRPIRTAIHLLRAFKQHSADFRWLQPPYEYEYKKMPIDILWGSAQLRRCIDSNGDVAKLMAS